LRITRLASAIASGGALSTLVSAVHERENRRTALRAELATLDGITLTKFDAVRVEEELRGYLTDWLSLAQRHPAQARPLLRKLLPRRIKVWRERCGTEKQYRYEGDAAIGRFFSGLVGGKRSGVPNGI
jgi:hypothetical protein